MTANHTYMLSSLDLARAMLAVLLRGASIHAVAMKIVMIGTEGAVTVATTLRRKKKFS